MSVGEKTNGPDVDSGQDEAEVSDFYFLVFICVVGGSHCCPTARRS